MKGIYKRDFIAKVTCTKLCPAKISDWLDEKGDMWVLGKGESAILSTSENRF